MTSPHQASAAVVDSHHHFWDLGRFEYPWMPQGPSVLRRDYFPEDLAPLLQRNGISRTVVVQAIGDAGETTFLLDLAEANDFVAGVVAWIDLTSPDAGKILDDLMKRRRIVGIRHQIHDEADDAWMIREDVIRGLRELERRELAYDLLVRPQHLKYVPALADKVPSLRMVVDHIAKPLIAQRSMDPWAEDIAQVAAIPGIYCKVSGMVTEADHAHWSPDDLKPYVSHVVEQFGLNRVMWGSDWPVCQLAATYEEVLVAALQAVGAVSDEEKARFLGGNAVEFYRL